MNKEYCFCTLAIGQSYRNCALLLARDLEFYAPKTELFILTDKPRYFQQKSNIKAFKYQPISCRIYNDKRIVISKALEFYQSCIFVDANIRIKEQIPDSINFKPGIVAYSCYNILKNFYKENKSNPYHKEYLQRNKMFKFVQQVASYYQLNLEQVKFVFEGIFYIQKNEQYLQFIRYWELLADYYEYQGLYNQEGLVIGLAAAAAGFPINYDEQKTVAIFKDVLEKYKIKVGKATYEENKDYFETLKKIEYPSVSFLHKVWNKISSKISFYYRVIKLNVRVLKYKEVFSDFSQMPFEELKDQNWNLAKKS
ncbi:hypothetical protein [Crocosphaera chwakensis]|uniref:Uncharacterized protein n=1 Tax=Crocosphaera chwakensis CCY0110 TaxID=391612 RepID=A3INA0_9CHRO|nr:hypothetical protein [Crocosphaera chwakensis]EAZ92077.1 hypothetical protein CY0110_00425 [Crocosphaera chwakensis CCY0110]